VKKNELVCKTSVELIRRFRWMFKGETYNETEDFLRAAANSEWKSFHGSVPIANGSDGAKSAIEVVKVPDVSIFAPMASSASSSSSGAAGSRDKMPCGGKLAESKAHLRSLFKKQGAHA
jgi:hypothetical protein